MKIKPLFFIAILTFFISFNCYSQSRFQPCQGENKSNWNWCYGKGLLANNDSYVGEWNDGKFNGKGTDTSSNGSKYIGDFRDHKRHGKGILYATTTTIKCSD